MKDAKGHGSEAHSDGVQQVGQALQPHGKPVPPNSISEIEAHFKAGGYLGIPSATRPAIIPAKTYDAWKASGKPLLRPEGDGYRMRQGKSSVYLLANQLRYGTQNRESLK